MKWSRILSVFTLECCLCLPAFAQEPFPGPTNNGLELRLVTVGGKAVPLRKDGRVTLGAFPENISFNFGPLANSNPGPIRLRYKLAGFDTAWHEGGGEMYLAARFLNDQG